MRQEDKLFEPSHYEAGDAHGLLSEFDPGTRTLPAGYQVDPRFFDHYLKGVDNGWERTPRPLGTWTRY